MNASTYTPIGIDTKKEKISETSSKYIGISSETDGMIHEDIQSDFFHTLGKSLTQSDIIPESERFPTTNLATQGSGSKYVNNPLHEIGSNIENNGGEMKDDDVNVLSGDNRVNVGIRPNVHDVRVQFCSCSIVLNCNSK